MPGYILHQDSHRVVIVTDESLNAKTGDMLQVWILPVQVSPLTLKTTNQDSLICGDCPHAGREGACYVNVAQAPQSVWHAFQRGSYPYLPKSHYPDVFTDRMVRWGAYGDPAYIPVDVLRWVSFYAAGWTGYTHQWRANQHLSTYLMASVDSELEAMQATAAGWRYFRVRTAQATSIQGEISCPASPEGGDKVQCIDCGLCNGVRYVNDPRKSITIIVHGSKSKNFISISGVK